ncbi:HAD family hydrolase [Fredinandcohnia sp. 179-A 10B2 NHS]|uniref:HAD family hydrolase n=1 Tax=Fredinandcohnia sp. 179-A 10B2 NHS TaxID=3235176 RepID=UPI0039A118F8
MIKLIVSDLDGTLLQNDNTVKDEDARALRSAVEEGIQISIATGRMDNEIIEVLSSINEKFHRISQNGAFVSTTEDKSIFSRTFETSTAELIYNKVLPSNFVTLICSYDTNYTCEENEYVSGIQERMFHPIIIDPAIGTKFDEVKPSKITLIGFENEIMNMEKQLKEELGAQIDLFISEKHVLDIMPKGISKGNALQTLLNVLSIKPEEIACIGDSFNDIPMFQLTPHSYVMSHAHDLVKQEAAHIVDSVAEAVAQIRLENQKQSV